MNADGTSRLLLLIDGDSYHVTKIVSDPGVVKVAWRLTKLASKGKPAVHDVSVDEHGAACTCGSWVYGTKLVPAGSSCKHTRSCRDVGLIP